MLNILKQSTSWSNYLMNSPLIVNTLMHFLPVTNIYYYYKTNEIFTPKFLKNYNCSNYLL